MINDIKNYLIKEISKKSKEIRAVEDFCKKLGTNPSSDIYYISLISYKKALEDTLRSIKE